MPSPTPLAAPYFSLGSRPPRPLDWPSIAHDLLGAPGPERPHRPWSRRGCHQSASRLPARFFYRRRTCRPLTDDGCKETKSWCDANENIVPGTLRAIDASTLKVVWTSDQSPDPRDRPGNVAKFTPVTVANGKVHVPTFSNKLVVYGLKP
jgi:hypothetical protein